MATLSLPEITQALADMEAAVRISPMDWAKGLENSKHAKTFDDMRTQIMDWVDRQYDMSPTDAAKALVEAANKNFQSSPAAGSALFEIALDVAPQNYVTVASASYADALREHAPVAEAQKITELYKQAIANSQEPILATLLQGRVEEVNKKYQEFASTFLDRRTTEVAVQDLKNVEIFLQDYAAVTQASDLVDHSRGSTTEVLLEKSLSLARKPDSASREAASMIVTTVFGQYPTATPADKFNKAKDMLEIATQLEGSTLISAATTQKLYEQAHFEAAGAPGPEGLAIAALASARLFATTAKETHLDNLILQLGSVKNEDFKGLFKNSLGDQGSWLSSVDGILQNTELRNAVSARIIANNAKTPDNIQTILDVPSKLVNWLKTPTSILGVSRLTGGPDAYKALVNAAKNGPPLAPEIAAAVKKLPSLAEVAKLSGKIESTMDKTVGKWIDGIEKGSNAAAHKEIQTAVSNWVEGQKLAQKPTHAIVKELHDFAVKNTGNPVTSQMIFEQALSLADTSKKQSTHLSKAEVALAYADSLQKPAIAGPIQQSGKISKLLTIAQDSQAGATSQTYSTAATRQTELTNNNNQFKTDILAGKKIPDTHELGDTKRLMAQVEKDPAMNPQTLNVLINKARVLTNPEAMVSPTRAEAAKMFAETAFKRSADGEAKAQVFLELAMQFNQHKHSTAMATGSKNLLESVITLCDKSPDNKKMQAIAGLAAAQLFHLDPANQTKHAEKVASTLAKTTDADFKGIKVNQDQILQNKELRAAVTIEISKQLKDDIKELLAGDSKVINWLRTPTSVLGLSKILGGGTDCIQKLENVANSPIITQAEAAASVSKTRNSNSVMLGEPSPFVDSKTLKTIEMNNPDWKFSDVKTSNGMVKEMSKDGQSIQINRSGVNSTSRELSTQETMLKVYLEAQKDPKHPAPFEIVLKNSDPAFRASWETACKKMIGADFAKVVTLTEPQPPKLDASVSQTKTLDSPTPDSPSVSRNSM
jgi:hypothetical protein